MTRTYKKLGTHQVVDLIPYIQSVITDRADVRIYIGSDSQNRKSRTVYATVIVIHFGSNGGHVIYQREFIPRVRDTHSRLWGEVERSVDLAKYLEDSGIPKPTFIDLDFNPDPKYRSNSILRSAVGYVEAMGYTPRIKPHAAAASHCADTLCHY